MLLEALMNQGFSFMRIDSIVSEHNENREMRNIAKRLVLLRQDVDRLPLNSLAFARIHKELGIRSTFYFRVVPQSFDYRVIEEIAVMGHEVGYHYEDFVFARQKTKVKRQKNKAQSSECRPQKFRRRDSETQRRSNNTLEHETWNMKPVFESAIESFGRNLEKLRKYADIKTICMHGSPMSRWDSRLLWKYFDYREFGVECEPYFDINFEDMLYLTDTGRKWNGSAFSVRDKAWGSPSSRLRRTKQGAGNLPDSSGTRAMSTDDKFQDWIRKPIQGSLMNMTKKSSEIQARYNLRTTNDIINAAKDGELPDRMMMTFHPQRWTDKPVPWAKELVWQNTKNVGKYCLIRLRK